MDEIYSHIFSIFTEEQQENGNKEPGNQTGNEQPDTHLTSIQQTMKIVLRIQHFVKIAFVIFIVPYCYNHLNTC